MSCIAINCSSVIPPPLQPNPDVAGTGVIVGFVATAYLTLLLLLIFYLLGFHETWSKNANKSNQIDSIVFEKFSKWFLFSKTPSYKWGGPVRAMIMVLSDQQIVTGLAILIAGYAQLSCSIDAYHWQIMASLAWFSSVTHLTTLTLLQDYLKQRPALRILRVFWLLVAVLWGTMGLFNTRKSIELYNNPPSWAQADFGKFPPYDGLEENGWAFGQIISVLLLAVPLLTMAEGLSDVYAMPSNSQAISLSTTNNTQHVIQYQPEGNWSYHQARTMSYTRNCGGNEV
ncbi:hypothetical protein EYC84_008767 [Monilinia fructicola]|uniref:Uncharacterized protein n=1 Tax=Monilinia fructicola TaxID=38448 RepID=A0A5M9JG96_MONFR|nr:hypothetical protein EYC84_008767 [Monilinia fructicola]